MSGVAFGPSTAVMHGPLALRRKRKRSATPLATTTISSRPDVVDTDSRHLARAAMVVQTSGVTIWVTYRNNVVDRELERPPSPNRSP